MTEHSVDLAGVGDQIAARQRALAIIAAGLGDEPLELLDVMIDGGVEIRIDAVATADLLIGLLALGRVEPAAEPAFSPRWKRSQNSLTAP